MSEILTWKKTWRWSQKDASGRPLTWNGLAPNNNPITTMPDIKVSFGVEDVLGYCQSTADMVNGYKPQMVAKGIDPAAMLTALGTAQTDLSAQNNVQEGLKTQLRDQTALVEGARDRAYTIASNLCDQLITAFGRTSEQAKEATNLRKKLRPSKPSSSGNTPTPGGNA